MQPDCTTPPLKTCTKCGREHPATLEYFPRSGVSGLRGGCKACEASRSRAYYAEHREWFAERWQGYYAEHAENLKDRRRAHHAEHREESLASHRAWYAEHREERAEYNRSWLAEHREERADYKAAHYAEHRDEILAYHAAYNAGHREEIAAYRADHREESAEYRRAYDAEHREEKAARTHNRRARKRNAPGVHTAADIRAQYARQNGRCIYCHEKVGDTYHRDHVMPLVLGGSNGPENIVIACPTCNLSKGGKHPMDFSGRLL